MTDTEHRITHTKAIDKVDKVLSANEKVCVSHSVKDCVYISTCNGK